MSIKFMNANEAKLAIGKGKQFLVFYADWCGPCKMMHPSLEELSSKVDIIKINTDENQEFAALNNVRGLPTIMIYNNGILQETLLGFQPKEVLEQKI